RIAQQIALAFQIQIDKDVVRRILAHHHRPGQDSDGPSWLTFLGHMKDSLWSIDLFRCESATLRTHWVLVVMDQYTRRIIGFGVHAGKVDGVGLCRMFNRAIRDVKSERRKERCHDQSQISARFDVNLTVVTYIRHPWLRNFPKTLDRCISGQPWENLQLNHPVFAFLVAGAARIRSFLFYRINSPETGICERLPRETPRATAE